MNMYTEEELELMEQKYLKLNGILMANVLYKTSFEEQLKQLPSIKDKKEVLNRIKGLGEYHDLLHAKAKDMISVLENEFPNQNVLESIDYLEELTLYNYEELIDQVDDDYIMYAYKNIYKELEEVLDSDTWDLVNMTYEEPLINQSLMRIVVGYTIITRALLEAFDKVKGDIIELHALMYDRVNDEEDLLAIGMRKEDIAQMEKIDIMEDIETLLENV